MKLYRFSPIKSKSELLKAIAYTHFACHKLCKQAFGTYFPVAGNIGIFCHFDDEYEFLTNLRKQLTIKNISILGKYFRLKRPITIPAQKGIPATTYTHLYIRKPDDAHPQVGDVDFYLPPEEYVKHKEPLRDGAFHNFARLFPRGDLDMIEVLDPKIDAATYIRSDEELTKL